MAEMAESAEMVEMEHLGQTISVELEVPVVRVERAQLVLVHLYK
jgi:hypothetical protein